eukprot:356712-Chlamydomonas_euryale.AAC.11
MVRVQSRLVGRRTCSRFTCSSGHVQCAIELKSAHLQIFWRSASRTAAACICTAASDILSLWTLTLAFQALGSLLYLWEDASSLMRPYSCAGLLLSDVPGELCCNDRFEGPACLLVSVAGRIAARRELCCGARVSSGRAAVT